ncbi:MAG: hypothetical protein HND48_14660 [Chloroflexi bacterium]|nr:hypothetical protein [Chloroflexota bacterium]
MAPLLSNALIITRREVRDSFRDWRIVGPIVILTFLFPALAQFVAARFSAFVEGFGAPVIGERTIPFLLMIVGFFPISISLVIALETFVGEKERRSLEPLLSTPLSNIEPVRRQNTGRHDPAAAGELRWDGRVSDRPAVRRASMASARAASRPDHAADRRAGAGDGHWRGGRQQSGHQHARRQPARELHHRADGVRDSRRERHHVPR